MQLLQKAPLAAAWSFSLVSRKKCYLRIAVDADADEINDIETANEYKNANNNNNGCDKFNDDNGNDNNNNVCYNSNDNNENVNNNEDGDKIVIIMKIRIITMVTSSVSNNYGSNFNYGNGKGNSQYR